MSAEARFDSRYPWLLAGSAAWFGAWGMQQVLLPWLVVNVLHSSATQTGIVQMATMLPTIFLLPFGGAALVWVPGVFYLLATGSIGLAMFLLAWGGVVSISDNFIRPMIISRYTPVPTLLVFLGNQLYQQFFLGRY